MDRSIFCSPVECVKLRKRHTEQELSWAAEIIAIYGCRPKNAENARALREFIADVFAAGQISGVRKERQRRAKSSCYPDNVTI